MKINGIVIFILITLLGSCSRTKTEITDKLSPEIFKNPPLHNQVYTWWHWVDNNITKEGITKDLESMKRNGIKGATLLNVSLFKEKDFGIPQVMFNSPEWYEMFRWVIKEAKRLDIEIGAHNCDGWSTSGGPWIKPENSMKQVVWRETFIEGGKKINMRLPVVNGNLNYYEDIAVLAFPTSKSSNSYTLFDPEVVINDNTTGNVLFDGNPMSNIRFSDKLNIDINMNSAFEASKLAIHLRLPFSFHPTDKYKFEVDILTSADGVHFQKKATSAFFGTNKNHVIHFTKIKAKHFKVICRDISPVESYLKLSVSEVELLKNSETPSYNPAYCDHLEKISANTYSEYNSFTSLTPNKGASAVDPEKIIDLTGNVDESGNLLWDAPKGKWALLRVGYTTTAETNNPATNAGRGLECDKMDTSALNLHFNAYAKKLIREAFKIKDNTFSYLLIDSWEAGNQNWTKNFPEEFKARRGYEIDKWIPVLCGHIVAGEYETQLFLQDFLRTIADLIEEYYYKQFAMLCQRNQIRSHAELIYGGTSYPPLDILKTSRHIDVPMYEFWSSNSDDMMIRYDPVENIVPIMAIQGGMLQRKAVVASEAYTGWANYSENPWDLKTFGDRAYCMGINRLVLHSYVLQPDNRLPGFTLGQFGSHFNRNNPWWNMSSDWLLYHSRIQYILQQGTTVANILFFVGDRLPVNHLTNISDLPYGYVPLEINTDALSHAQVKNGAICLRDERMFKVLILPDDNGMSYETLQKLQKLVKNGAALFGDKPEHILSMTDLVHKGKFKMLANDMWGENYKPEKPGSNKFGKGKIYWGSSFEEMLTKVSVKPLLKQVEKDSVKILFYQKQIDNKKVFFLVNQQDKQVKRNLAISDVNEYPKIWRPQYGTVTPATFTKIADGRTNIELIFDPRESYFLVFDENGPRTVQSPKCNELPITNISIYLKIKEQNISVSEFTSWTRFSDESLKYFSGIGTYTINFDIEGIRKTDSLMLAITDFKSTANINVNNVDLGDMWIPGHKVNVTGILKEKNNVLVVKVANVYRNRIIGDLHKFGEIKSCFTTAKQLTQLSKDMPLQGSGIMGPIKIYRY